jgi:hypothetical protein
MDVTMTTVTLEELMQFRADQFFVALSLPSFVTLDSTGATMEAVATLENGNQSSAAFSLVRDANGFRFANAGAVDYWSATAGANAVSGTWSISNMTVVASQAGSGRFGVAQALGSKLLSSFSSAMTVTAGSNGPPGRYTSY